MQSWNGRRERSVLTVHLVASLGGHLELLTATAGGLGDVRRVWVTSEGARAESLRRGGDRVATLPRLDRSSMSLRSVVSGVLLAVRERPRTVVTSGAGLAVPFCLTARLLGGRLVFVETMARVTTGSSSGRLLSRFSDAVLVQWPELLGTYPDAVLCRPALLEGISVVGGAEGDGTFVTVGSHDQPFDRLLAAADRAAAAGVLPGPVFAQHGVSGRPSAAMAGSGFVSPEEFADRVNGASVVVTHGGAGAIATALRAGRKPIVVARRSSAGEHVDDHQAELVAKLDSLGLVVEAQDEITPDDVARATTARVWTDEAEGAGSVSERLAEIVSELVGRTRTRTRSRPEGERPRRRGRRR